MSTSGLEGKNVTVFLRDAFLPMSTATLKCEVIAECDHYLHVKYSEGKTKAVYAIPWSSIAVIDVSLTADDLL